MVGDKWDLSHFASTDTTLALCVSENRGTAIVAQHCFVVYEKQALYSLTNNMQSDFLA